MASFLYVMFQAMANDQASVGQQQIVDSFTAMMNTKTESNIYQQASGKGEGTMGYAEGKIESWVKDLAAHSGDSNARAKDQAEIQKYQTMFTQAQTTAQTQEQQADGNVQTAQNQAGQDSTNLQQKTTLAQALNSIGSMLANLLSGHY